MKFFYSIAISMFKKPINNKAIEAKSSWQPIDEFYDMWRQCTVSFGSILSIFVSMATMLQ